MNGPVTTAEAPSLGLFLTEPARTITQLAELPLAAPLLRRAPRPDVGHGVLVLPGLMTTDASTALLRRYLHGLGHSVWGWRLGRNLGPTSNILAGIPRTAELLAERTSGPISIVGWSLGGVFGRELARRRPELVRQVVTLGSPFALSDPSQSRVGFAYRRNASRHVPADAAGPKTDRPIPVPSTAVYSKRDGVVHWRTCIEPESEVHQNVEVRCAHLAFGTDPATLWVIADRLAQDVPGVTRFEVPKALRLLYPR